MLELAFIDQLDGDLDAGLPARFVHAFRPEALVAQERPLIEGELEADRIDRYDHGQHRGVSAGAAGHEVAFGHAPVADPAGDRRLELGELKVELGLADRRFLRRHRGLGDAFGLRALLEGLLRDGAILTSCEARARSLSVKARLARACASVARTCASEVSKGGDRW